MKTGQDEPVALTTAFGQGRCFNLVLGHDVRAIANAGFQTLLLRGTQWAATGKVTIPVPAALAAKAPPPTPPAAPNEAPAPR